MEVHPQTGQTALPSHTNQAKTLTGEIPQPRKEVNREVNTFKLRQFCAQYVRSVLNCVVIYASLSELVVTVRCRQQLTVLMPS